VRAFSVHPGEILTDLIRYLDKDDLAFVGALDEHGNIRPAKACWAVEPAANPRPLGG